MSAKKIRKKTPAKPVTKRAARPVEVRVDAALKKAWARELSELRRRSAEGMRSFDAKYESVGHIIHHDPPLYLAGGVARLSDFVATYLPGETVRSVERNVRIAEYASPVEEERYGTSKIDAALDFLEAKNGRPIHGRLPVDFAKLRVPAQDGTVAFEEASVAVLRDAKRKLDKGGRTAKPSPVVTELRKRIPAEAKEITVHYADGRITIGRIPARLFKAVLRALGKAKIPE